MKVPTRRLLVAAASVLLVGTVIAGAALASPRPGPAELSPNAETRSDSVIVESLPGLVAAESEPQLASLRGLAPRPGAILQAAGPFDDRFRFEQLLLTGGEVTGAVRVTSDVSELLELVVVAGFYDAQGRLLGTHAFVHHQIDEPSRSAAPLEVTDFTIPVPRQWESQAVAAAVGVPVLVNE